jgi:hypothetical protein
MSPSILHLGLDPYADPLWTPRTDGKLGTISPSRLKISKALVDDLRRWASDYDAEFERGGDRFDVNSLGAMDLHDRGMQLWQRLVDEIGENAEIHYDSPVHGESYRVHRPNETIPR